MIVSHKFNLFYLYDVPQGLEHAGGSLAPPTIAVDSRHQQWTYRMDTHVVHRLRVAHETLEQSDWDSEYYRTNA